MNTNFLRNLLGTFYSRRTLYVSLPWIFLLTGLFFLAISEFGKFVSTTWNDLFEQAGNSIIIGGIVSLLLKSMQFLGIIKEELSKIISAPDYLKNRHDLDEYWDTVTCVLFENKFPAINKLITKNIKNVYLPTKELHYYENSLEILDIELIDTALGIVKVVQKSSFTLIPSAVPYSNIYPYKIEIKGTSSYSPTFKLDYVKMNDMLVDVPAPPSYEGYNLVAGFNLNIEGNHNQFLIEYQITRTFPLTESSLIFFRNNHIYHNYRVHLFFHNLKITFYETGMIGKFRTVYETSTVIEKEFSGLMYKGQGFALYLEK